VTGFLLIWGGQLVSQTGTAMTRFALLVWVYEQTGRAASVALLGFCAFVPFIAVSPFAGVWVDRLDRRRVMLWADLGAGATTAAVLLLYAAGELEIWHLYMAEALAGAFEAFQIPAFTAASTLLVPPRHYARVSGLRSVATLGAEGVAPFAAGLALTVVGVAGVMLIDLAAVLAAVATLLMVHLPRPTPGGAPSGAFWAELAGGARFIADRPGLLGLLLIFTGINLFAALTYFAILPAMVLARSGRDALALASVQSANGLAGVAGGLVMGVWGGPRRKIHGVLAGAALSFLVGDLLFAMGRTTAVWVLGALLGSALVPVITACNQAIWQTRVPADIQGRVFGLCAAIRVSSMPLGYLVGGFAADLWMEPAMAPGGPLATRLGWLVGVGPGAGMAAMFLATAVLGAGVSLIGYLFPAVRDVERTAS
jgi:MFS family permease